MQSSTVRRFRIPLALIALLFSVSDLISISAADQPSDSDPMPKSLTVATWNLEWFYDAYKGDNLSDLSRQQSAPSDADWQWKVAAVAESLAKLNADIVCLQEIENRRVLGDLTKALRENHGQSFRVAYIEGSDTFTEQDVAILFRGGLVEFSRREQSKPMFDSREYYNLSKHIIAKFQWSDGQHVENLTLINVHLRATAEAAPTRIQQAKLIRRWIEQPLANGENVIVLGDLNTEEGFDSITPNGDMATLMGRTTSASVGDLVDLNQFAAADKRNSHIILKKEFDRILVSQSLLSDTPGVRDLVFDSIQSRLDLTIRGSGVDTQHWENYWGTDSSERDISDHAPVVAKWLFK